MKIKIVLILTALTTTVLACGNEGKESSSEVKAIPVTSAPQTPTAVAPQPEDTVKAEVVIVKYSDYQCPACKYYADFVQKAKQDFGGKIEVVYKHFPLNIHPYAELAARSAEAAKKQGKFAEMHELIFAGLEQWSKGNAEGIFLGYAEHLGLNMEDFRKDMNSAQMQRIVVSDKRQGMALGVRSTPTFYINDIKLENNPRYYEDFKALIEEALK